MIIRLLVVATTILFVCPVWSDSINILGSIVILDGRGDFFDQIAAETTLDTLEAFGLSVGYDHFVGKYINIGGSVSYQSGNSSVADRDFRFSDGRPVVKDLGIKLVPLELSAVVFPRGRNNEASVYGGGGVGFYFWEYEEEGDFVVNRNSDPIIVPRRGSSDGSDLGFHVLGGVQGALWQSVSIKVQVKHSWLKGELSDDFDSEFNPVDFSFVTVSAGISIKI